MAKNPYLYSIPEWYGIQQQKDGTLLPIGTAYDARNIETGDGNLATAKGFTKWINAQIPGRSRILRLIIAKGTGHVYVVTRAYILSWQAATSEWVVIYHFDDDLTTDQVDVVETRIGATDVVLIATGSSRIVKINTQTDAASDFGAGEYSYTGTVSAFDSTQLKITVSPAMDAEAQRRCLAYGVTCNDYYGEVSTCTATVITLKYAMNGVPAAGDTVTVRGGGSDEHVGYIELFANRLFSAGDPDAPFRLYWSAVPGDGRTVEDWLSVEGSYDASGGYVEVGDSSADAIIGLTATSNQLIIWKRYSVWRMFGDRPSTFTLERIDRESDFMSNAGVITKYDTPYLLMPNGIHAYNNVSVVPVDNGERYLRRFFELEPDVSNSRAASCNNRFYMSCKVNPASTYDDTIIVYDVARGSYMIRDGFEIADMTSVGSHIYIVSGDRYICEFERGTSYNGSPINAWWITQPMDFGAKMNRHQLSAMYAHLAGDSMKVTAIGDHLNSPGCVVPLRLRDSYTTVRFQTDQSYVVHLKFENIDGSAFCVCGGVNLYIRSELKE